VERIRRANGRTEKRFTAGQKDARHHSTEERFTVCRQCSCRHSKPESFVSRSRRSGARVFALVGVLLLSACLKSTEPQPSLLQLNGSWKYTGAQTVPAETLTGTLIISRESGSSFQGQLNLVGVNSQTQQQKILSGSVSGSESGTDVIDFDANLAGETTPRRHVGKIVADTISGTWVSSADGTMASGTFRVEREPK
jgi:hypothetical protein